MLRASSEMMVAISVDSVSEKPDCSASSRPLWRAVTMSATVLMGMVFLPSTGRAASGSSLDGSALLLIQLPRHAALGAGVEVGETLLEIECGGHAFQAESQLHHRERHLRLDADDDRVGAAQADHVGHVPQRAHREGI